MQFTGYSFGSIRVDGVTYGHDLIIDRGKVRKRKKAASRKFRGAYGHTPLSAAEDIPWRYRRLVIGTGAAGALPVMQQVRNEGPPPQGRTGCPAHSTGDRHADRGWRAHQCHLAPDVLSLPPRYLRAVSAAAPRRRAGAGAMIFALAAARQFRGT